MLMFVLRRLGLTVVLLWAVSTAVFFLSAWLIPGDFATVYRLSLSTAEVAEIRDALGLDDPLWSRYLRWLGQLIRGDLGVSFSGGRVIEIVHFILPWTMVLLVFGVGAGVGAGFVAGRFLGWRATPITERSLIGAAGLSTLFPPWIAFILAYAAAGILGFEGMLAFRELDATLWPSEDGITGTMWFLVGSGLVGGTMVWGIGRLLLWRRASVRFAFRLATLGALSTVVAWAVGLPRLIDLAGVLVLPLVAVCVINLGDATILTATLTGAERHSAYVSTARAKGLTERLITRRHVGRNVVLPILSRYVASLPLVFGLMLIIESSFGNQAEYSIFLAGVGQSVFFALVQRNIPVVLGGLLVVGAIALMARLALDVIHAALDPRLRHTINPGQQP